MSDDNLMTLEDDGGTTAADVPAAPPAPAVDATAPPPEPEPAPAAALPTEATDAQPVASAAAPTDPRLAGMLRDLQKEREEKRQWRQAAERGMQVIESDPKLRAAMYGQPPPPPAAAEPVAEVAPRHELEAIARQNVWYDKDGQPDLAAASNFLTMVDQRAASHAERIVNARMAPYERNQVQSVATGRRAEAMQVAQQLNIPAETAAPIIDGLMATNPELLADPQTATMAVLAAAGLHYVQQQHGAVRAAAPAAVAAAPAAPRPTFVEQGQGVRPAAGVMSQLGTRLAKAAGVAPKAWQSIGSAYEKEAGRTLMRFDSEEDK